MTLDVDLPAGPVGRPDDEDASSPFQLWAFFAGLGVLGFVGALVSFAGIFYEFAILAWEYTFVYLLFALVMFLSALTLRNRGLPTWVVGALLGLVVYMALVTIVSLGSQLWPNSLIAQSLAFPFFIGKFMWKPLDAILRAAYGTYRIWIEAFGTMVLSSLPFLAMGALLVATRRKRWVTIGLLALSTVAFIGFWAYWLLFLYLADILD